jgi:hypothetical protein
LQHCSPQIRNDMAEPFKISFAFRGRECFANVYTHEGKLKEYHIHIAVPDISNGLPARIVLLDVAGNLHLSEPLNLSKAISQPIISAIQKNIL